MSAVGYREAIGELEAFLEDYDWRYSGEAFVVQTHVARWLLADDGSAALSYLEKPENTKSLGLVAAALADLHHQAALPVLRTKHGALGNPIAKEAFHEAIHRLETQLGAPDIAHRMIWMFGVTSSTEQALGADSDNVFVQRAMAATGQGELGRVTEVDDSAAEDY
jgi:hypothetical protein